MAINITSTPTIAIRLKPKQPKKITLTQQPTTIYDLYGYDYLELLIIKADKNNISPIMIGDKNDQQYSINAGEQLILTNIMTQHLYIKGYLGNEKVLLWGFTK